MTINYPAVPSNTGLLADNDAAVYAVGNFITGYTTGNLYIFIVTSKNTSWSAIAPTSLTNNHSITWSFLGSNFWDSNNRCTAYYCGIATDSSFGAVTTVTYAATQLGAYGGMIAVAGITDDSLNGVSLINEIVTQEITNSSSHSLSFAASDPTWGCIFSPICSFPSGGTSLEDFTFDGGGWTFCIQGASVVDGYPGTSYEASGKNGVSSMTGTWSATGGGRQEPDSFAVALQILVTAPEAPADPAALPGSTFTTPSIFRPVNWFGDNVI